ncbi:MAG: hypothetical protein AAF890_03410 [Pseudomonadota bacterium]
MAKKPSADTITQAYAKPLNHNGKRYEAGTPVELPSARAKVMEARLGLHASNKDAEQPSDSASKTIAS